MVNALGVQKAPGVSMQTALKRFLRSRQLLLVLDNFEHVLPAALSVADLLATCAGLKVLATSRIPLRLQGERQLPVSPLSVPDSDRGHSLADVAGAEAVQLFVARAQEVQPDFALNDDNAGEVVEICRRLDGLPLALELAAVRVKILPPRALLRRLERRLTLLTGGAQDLPARHQALRATIAWSYDLLSPGEQALFRRLAVFAGSWTLEAAEAVITPDGTLSIVDGLASLVDKSLVQPADGLGGDPRYLMLETVREFAVEQMEDSGEAETLGRSLADYCLALAQVRDSDLSDSAFDDSQRQLEAEQANIQAALAWLRDRELTRDGLRLATTLGEFWGLRIAHTEGRAWMETFLAQPDATELSPRECVIGLWVMGGWASTEGDLVTAKARIGESLALAQHVGDKRGISIGMGAVAMAFVHNGDVSESIALFDEAVPFAREVGNRRNIALLLGYLAYATGHQGDLARAEALAAESLALVHSFGATRGLEASMTVMFQGWLAIMADDDDLAATRFETALALGRGLHSKELQSVTLAGLAEVAFSCGRIDEASAHYHEGLVMGWEGLLPLGMVFNLQGLVRLAIRRGAFVRAARLAGALETFGNTLQTMPVACVHRYEADVAHLREMLGEEAFEAEVAHGRAFQPAEIVAAALAFDEERLPPLNTQDDTVALDA